MRGCVHIYTGDGKGKTTAAIGAAVRYAGHGGSVYIFQFLKGRICGEHNALKNIENIHIKMLSKDYGFYKSMSEADKKSAAAEHGTMLAEAAELAAENNGCLIILDEIFGACNNGLADKGAVMNIINKLSDGAELILTGRNAPEEFIRAADYVSEINKIKHPFDRGIQARPGIEY